MANVKSNRLVSRSESMKLSTGATRTNPISSSPSWSSANGNSCLQTSKPISEAAARNSSHLRTLSSGDVSTNISPRASMGVSSKLDKVLDSPSQGRQTSKHSSSQAIQRLINGGRPVQRRLSLDTTMSKGTHRKPILRNRRSSVSYGELSSSGSLNSSPSLTFSSNRPSSSLAVSTSRASSSPSASSQTFTDSGRGSANNNDEAILKFCNYRLASFSVTPSESGAKKVSFDDQILVISK